MSKRNVVLLSILILLLALFCVVRFNLFSLLKGNESTEKVDASVTSTTTTTTTTTKPRIKKYSAEFLLNPSYENAVKAENVDSLTVLVNKNFMLESNYVPSDLEVISSKCSLASNLKVRKIVKEKFETLCMDVSNISMTIKAVSAYRSYDRQKQLYSNYVARDGKKLADTYSARAGYSEHQTGLAIDVAGSNYSYTKFENTEEYKWLRENAHKYGFIIRYQKGKESITGYQAEAWHIRYLGENIATYIYENGITYEEYYNEFFNWEE